MIYPTCGTTGSSSTVGVPHKNLKSEVNFRVAEAFTPPPRTVT